MKMKKNLLLVALATAFGGSSSTMALTFTDGNFAGSLTLLVPSPSLSSTLGNGLPAICLALLPPRSLN